MGFTINLLIAVQKTGTLIIEGLRVQEANIRIRELCHPYAFVEGADIFTNMACQSLEIAIPVDWYEVNSGMRLMTMIDYQLLLKSTTLTSKR